MVKISKPKDLEEVHSEIYKFLKEKYGDAVVSKENDEAIIILTEKVVNGVNDILDQAALLLLIKEALRCQ